MLNPTYIHMRCDHDGGHHQRGIGQPLLIQAPTDQFLQKAIEQPIALSEEHRKENADENLADEIGGEDRQAEKTFEPIFAGVQKQCQTETQRQLQQDRADGEEDRVPERYENRCP